MRTGARLRMILHAKERQRAMAKTFKRIVVQVDMRQIHLALLERVRIDGKVMVVRGDLDFARLRMLHRMVAAMMSKFQLVGLAAKRKTNQLMSQTNAEHRLASGKLADILLRVGQGLGIAGSIRQENTVRLERQHIFRRGLGRNHRDPAGSRASMRRMLCFMPKSYATTCRSGAGNFEAILALLQRIAIEIARVVASHS